MTDEPANGRASIREVYKLVGEVRKDIADLDGKVDGLATSIGAQHTRLTVVEKTCAERPRVCSLEIGEAIRTAAVASSDRRWTSRERWLGIGAVMVAVSSALAGWLS